MIFSSRVIVLSQIALGGWPITIDRKFFHPNIEHVLLIVATADEQIDVNQIVLASARLLPATCLTVITTKRFFASRVWVRNSSCIQWLRNEPIRDVTCGPPACRGNPGAPARSAIPRQRYW